MLYNIVYLNTNIYGYELGTYLLQKKYKSADNNENVQTSRYIHKIKKSTDVNMIHISATWEYDTATNTTKYLLIFDNSLSINEKEILVKYFKILKPEHNYCNLIPI